MCYYKSTHLANNKIFVDDIGVVFSLDHPGRPILSGFDYDYATVIRASADNSTLETAPMEWGFLPPTWKTREEVALKRTGYKRPDGTWQEPILTLNAKSEELLQPFKMYREAALHRRAADPRLRVLP